MSKAKAVNISVITPEHKVLETSAESVVIPAHDGEIGILRNRAPLMCELGIGEMRYTADGKTSRLFVDGGFAQVHDNSVIVLTENALPESAIDAKAIAAAEQRSSQAKTPADRAKSVRRVHVLRAMAAH